MYTDGASRGNPGPAAYAVILCSDGDKVIKKFARYIGNTTNNEAEYQGLIAGIQEALKVGGEELEVVSDSELTIKQMNGQYSVKAANLRPLHQECKSLANKFAKITFRNVPREHPMIKQADALANEELDIMKKLRPRGTPNP